MLSRWRHFSPFIITLELSDADIRFRTDKRKYVSTLCIINLQNSLPQDMVIATSIYSFKTIT